MPGKFKQTVLGTTLLLGILTSPGCVPLLVGAAAGVGGYVWSQNAAFKDYEFPVSKVHRATVDALKGLQLPVMEDEHDRVSAVVRSEFSNGQDVKITINAVTERSCKIKIKVGIFGDQTKSELILDAIDKRL